MAYTFRPAPVDLSQYTLSSIASPRGANTLGAQAAYESRKMYKEVPYFLNLPNPIRSLYDKLYFGRVDRYQNGILIKCDTELLKQVRTEGENVFVLNFVADAFEDLRDHLKRVGDHGLINTDSFYYELNPVGGLERMQNRFPVFYKTWNARLSARINSTTKGKMRVVDFPSYVEALLQYMDSGVTQMPITTTGIVVSNFSTPMIGGLSLELAGVNYSIDKPKVREYVFDSNFRYFVRAARKYGFYVDRNGPWKLTADVFSTPMLEYMLPYGVTKETFFDTYYNRTYTLDLDNLKRNLKDMYNQFVTDYPRVTIRSRGTVACPSGELVEKKLRRTASAEELEELGEVYWLDLYFKLRAKEAQVGFTQYRQKFTTVVELYKSLGVESALRYINNEIKPYLYSLKVGKIPLTKASGPIRIGTVSDAPTIVAAAQDVAPGGSGGSSY